MISIGTASGSVPWKTVQAMPFMPGLTSLSRMISTLPALGRAGGRIACGQGERHGRESEKDCGISQISWGQQLQFVLLYYDAVHKPFSLQLFHIADSI